MHELQRGARGGGRGVIPASAKTRQMRAWAWTFMAAFGLITLASTWEGLLFMLGLALALTAFFRLKRWL